MNEQERDDADPPDQQPRRQGDGDVGAHRADPRELLVHEAHGEPVQQTEDEDRPESEHHRGVAIEAVAKSPPPGARMKLPNRQRIDVAHAAAVQVAGGGMMDGVRAAPIVVGGQGQQADDAPRPVVRGPRGEERPVAAIMLDHEQPQQQSCRGQHEQCEKPVVAEMGGRSHRGPGRRKRTSSDCEFQDAPPGTRLAIGAKFPQPVTCCDAMVRVGRFGCHRSVLHALEIALGRRIVRGRHRLEPYP